MFSFLYDPFVSKSSFSVSTNKPIKNQQKRLLFGHSSVLKPGEDSVAFMNFTRFVQPLQKNIKSKAKSYIEPLANLKTGNSPVVIDLGCSTGELVRELSSSFPKYHFIGVDINPKMIEKAKHLDTLERSKNSELGFIKYQVEDATELKLKPKSVDAFILSSVFHELYSYNSPAFSKDALMKIFKGISKVLKPGGRVIIRDPGKPDNANEQLTLKVISTTNKLNPKDIKVLLKAEPESLSPSALVRRFMHQFEPAKGKIKEIDENSFQMPAWLVSEFLRHRQWTKPTSHWNSEIREQYGVFTKQEMTDFVKDVKLKPVNLSNNFSFRSVGTYDQTYPNEYLVQNKDGKVLEKEKLLPRLSAILEKPVGIDT